MAKLYAIAGTPKQARFYLEAGVPYLQLRFKPQPLQPHIATIRDWTSRHSKTKIIINDCLNAALQAQVWGVHLGQEDLLRYPQTHILNSGLRVGISTHNKQEIEAAVPLRPALLGFGPIYATQTKHIKHLPQGVARLQQQVNKTSQPLAAIGGIDERTMEQVARTGVNFVAIISALTRLTQISQIQDWMSRLAQYPARHPFP